MADLVLQNASILDSRAGALRPGAVGVDLSLLEEQGKHLQLVMKAGEPAIDRLS